MPEETCFTMESRETGQAQKKRAALRRERETGEDIDAKFSFSYN